MPLPPFPVRAVAKPAYRFLDTWGLPDMPGDVRRFSSEHFDNIIGAPGDPPVLGKWRPFNRGIVPTLGVVRGCLSVVVPQQAAFGFAYQSGSAHILLPGDFDVVIELLISQQLMTWPNDPGDTFAAGVYVDQDGDGRGAGVFCMTAEDTSAVAVEYLCQFDTDLQNISGEAPITPTTTSIHPADRLRPLLLRVKRIDDTARLYASYSGYNWKFVGVQAFGSTVDPCSLGIFAWSTMASPTGDMSVSVAGVKFLDPTAEFPV